MACDAQHRQQLVDRLARRIAGLGMIAPAILFLETYKPLAFLGAQMLWITQPFLSLGFDAADVQDVALLMEDRAGIADLIDHLENLQTSHPSSPIDMTS